MEGLGTNGHWGGICEDSFTINDAHVICRMLGHPLAAAVSARGLYGAAPSDKFVLDELHCTGNETSIFDCQHDGEWKENCVATEIAGVHCARSKL